MKQEQNRKIHSIFLEELGWRYADYEIDKREDIVSFEVKEPISVSSSVTPKKSVWYKQGDIHYNGNYVIAIVYENE